MTRRLAFVFGALAVVAAAWLVASAYLFVWPEDDRVLSADALVVLGPGPHGERARRATELLRDQVADSLVVSEPRTSRGWGQLRAWCTGGQATCFRAKPFTTRGEAKHVGRLARLHNWRSLIVVTSRYHVVRTRLLFKRCFPGTLMVVGAAPGSGRRELVQRTTHEWGGVFYALTFGRGC